MIFIEHNGTAEHNDIAKYIREYIEDHFGIASEFLIGYSKDPIVVYTEDLDPIVSFDAKPNDDILNFYFALREDDDDK